MIPTVSCSTPRNYGFCFEDIYWDGMDLVDDVGGIRGFCKFLETINGPDPEEKKSYKEWAKSLGWTGRMSKPENIL